MLYLKYYGVFVYFDWTKSHEISNHSNINKQVANIKRAFKSFNTHLQSLQKKLEEVDYPCSVDFPSIPFTQSHHRWSRWSQKDRLAWYASSCCAVKMVCLFPMSERTKHPASGPSLLQRPALTGICQIWNTGTIGWPSRRGDRVSACRGGPLLPIIMAAFHGFLHCERQPLPQWVRAGVQHHAKPYQPPLVPLCGQRLRRRSGYTVPRRVFVLDKWMFWCGTRFAPAEDSLVLSLC